MAQNKVLYPFLASLMFFAIAIALISFEGEEWQGIEVTAAFWGCLLIASVLMMVTYFKGSKYYPIK